MTTTEDPTPGSDAEPIRTPTEAALPVHEPVAVYESSRTGMPKLRPYARNVRQLWPFMWYQARADLKADNYNTALGQFWLLLNPLLLAVVFIFGRSVLRPLGSPESRDFLIAHLIGGLFFYQYVVQGWQTGSKSLVRNKPLIECTSFPRMVFPFTSSIQALMEFLPLLAALFLARAYLDQPFGWSLLALPLIVVLLGLLSLGMALGSAIILLYFRDFANIISLVARLWLWATPILYTSSEIPENVKPYLEMNPLYPSYVAMESIFAGDWPPVKYLLWAAAWTAVMLFGGGYLFLTRERDVAVRI